MGDLMPARAFQPLEGRMADETPHGEQGAPAPSNENQEPEKQETDWKAESRKWEARAKENLAAAKANEDAAQRLAQIEDAQKTEAQRAQEALVAAEKRADESELRAARAEVARTKGVPPELLTGSTQAELEASADALLEFQKQQQPEQKGLHIPSEGKTPAKPGSSLGEQFAGFVTNQLGG